MNYHNYCKYNMSTKTLQKLKKCIENFTKKKEIKSILVALSGGQDSILLIKILENLNAFYKKELKISYIHIDHQWKNDSNKQIKHIVNYIKSIHKKVVIYQIYQTNISENECRKQRYYILKQHAIKYKYKLIITGHNKTDKIETFLQSIHRGSGIEGLTSLTIHNRIDSQVFILRPLLSIDKENIYWLCKKLHLPIWSDSTNYIYQIRRNRIRYELLPYLKNFLNDKVKDNIISLVKHYHYENEYIKQNIIKLYLKSKHELRIAINHKLISKHNFNLQIRTIQMFYLHNFQLNFDSKKIIKIITRINKNFHKIKIILEDAGFIHTLNKTWLYVEIKR
uniref:tRNA(Ile)-lysidine synthase n=1 Tax=Vertebrata lanosa TaxID=1261582 RepID=A0A0B5VQV8_9FLOR|nr:tRNA(Ile)-lysidine synthase [Vertebrata lanosa]AJH66017.1 tRNA(Ile)-lysidine synthase [Vertebrata lanosa]